jgi:hypothetical protein
MSSYSNYHYITTSLHHDIELKVLVVGEQHIWAYAMIAFKGYSGIGGLDLYNVPLSAIAIEKGNNRRSKRSLWGVKKWGKDKESECWCKVGFYKRTLELNYEDTQARYNGGNFGAVAICYDPNSPRMSFELVWTKVCPGLLLRYKCSKIIGY